MRKVCVLTMIHDSCLDILPYYCFDVLNTRLVKIQPDNRFVHIPSTKYPLFVTWKKKDEIDGEYQLRGCIGTFTPVELASGTRHFALNSAFNDCRFPRITEKELHLLSCTVSLLVHFNDAKHLEDWDIHFDGIEINFSINGNDFSATYLPGIANEQGWTKIQTIHNLIIKSSYKGPITKHLESMIKVTRYQALKFHCTYEEYQVFKSVSSQ